jgi:FdhD protein
MSEKPSRPAAIRTLRFAGDAADGLRPVAVETPVQVTFAEMPFGVMMLTPADLEDFAYGFSLTEGIINTAAELRAVTAEPLGEGLRLRIDLAGARLHAHLARQRALSGRTSCGLCGITDMDELQRAETSRAPAPCVGLAAIEAALGALDGLQPLNAETRAVHGAAWCTLKGAVTHVREDVGRHNALDKLVGALLRDGTDPAQGFVLITSRASFEMVEKVARFGVKTLVAISAPTSLALDRAKALDIALVGIARRDAVTVFWGAERIVAG